MQHVLAPAPHTACSIQNLSGGDAHGIGPGADVCCTPSVLGGGGGILHAAPCCTGPACWIQASPEKATRVAQKAKASMHGWFGNGTTYNMCPGLTLCTAEASAYYRQHTGPMPDQPCTLDPGPIQIGAIDWPYMPEPAHKAGSARIPHAAPCSRLGQCAMCSVSLASEPWIASHAMGQGHHGFYVMCRAKANAHVASSSEHIRHMEPARLAVAHRGSPATKPVEFDTPALM